MSKQMKFFLIGWVLIFGIAACSQRGDDELVSDADESPSNQASAEGDVDVTENQAPDENSANIQSGFDYDELEIITLLPRDGIPAIDNPQFLSAQEADDEYAPEELVLGVNYDGDARAYSIPYLSSHEIVNDTVGGRKITVTW